jgi:hypothetical protein
MASVVPGHIKGDILAILAFEVVNMGQNDKSCAFLVSRWSRTVWQQRVAESNLVSF